MKLDAATGALQCSTTPLYALGEASPVVATPPGGQRTIFMGSVDLAQNGPVYAFSTADCSAVWRTAPYPVGGGVWDFLSYAVDAPTPAFPGGQPLVLFGTSDPDGEMYALNASTGALVWRFQTQAVNNDSDVGAGVAISAPGVNGFADGVAYTNGKDGITYAVDLTTGALIWSYVFEPHEVANRSRSTPTLAGNQLVFGTSEGTFDLNATTGALIWHYVLPAGDENLGSVAIEGPTGQRVVLTTNLYGQFQVLSLATGALLYSYQTGSYIGSSPALVKPGTSSHLGRRLPLRLRRGGCGQRISDDGRDVTHGQLDHRQSRPADHLGNGQRSGRGEPGPGAGARGRSERHLVDRGQRHLGGRSVQQPGHHGQSEGATSTTWSLKLPLAARGTIFEVWSSAVDANGIADIPFGRQCADHVARFVHRPAQQHGPDTRGQRPPCSPRGRPDRFGRGLSTRRAGDGRSRDLPGHPARQRGGHRPGHDPVDSGDRSRHRRLRAHGAHGPGPEFGEHR